MDGFYAEFLLFTIRFSFCFHMPQKVHFAVQQLVMPNSATLILFVKNVSKKCFRFSYHSLSFRSAKFKYLLLHCRILSHQKE